jgi:hypothetical protein
MAQPCKGPISRPGAHTAQPGLGDLQRVKGVLGGCQDPAQRGIPYVRPMPHPDLASFAMQRMKLGGKQCYRWSSMVGATKRASGSWHLCRRHLPKDSKGRPFANNAWFAFRWACSTHPFVQILGLHKVLPSTML